MDRWHRPVNVLRSLNKAAANAAQGTLVQHSTAWPTSPMQPHLGQHAIRHISARNACPKQNQPPDKIRKAQRNDLHDQNKKKELSCHWAG